MYLGKLERQSVNIVQTLISCLWVTLKVWRIDAALEIRLILDIIYKHSLKD